MIQGRSKLNKLALGAAALLAVTALGAAACSSSTSNADKTATASAKGGTTPAATSAATKAAGATSAATSAATAAATKAATTPVAGATAAGKSTVNVGDTAIGKVLVDDKGMTLYTFKNDVPNSGKSAVPAAILANWPPLVATGAGTKGAGVTGDLGTATLDDGSKLVSYKGLPLYHFSGDKAVGDTKGDKLAGIWFVAVP